MPQLTRARAEQVLKSSFAEWIQELDLSFEAIEPERLCMRLPFHERLVRSGGIVCGQALMAAADTAMVFAIANALGEFRPMTTVSQSTSFMRAATEGDIILEVEILKLGRKIVFGEVTMYADGEDEPLAHAACTYALLAEKS